MAKRYIPKHPMSTAAGGYNQVFTPDRVGEDGSVGYSYAEVKHLGKPMLADAFREVEFSADGVIESATAAPGEKRTVKARTKKTAS